MSEQPKTLVFGKIRTRHWVFGIGLPVQGIATVFGHPHPFDPQMIVMYASLIYGMLDWHKNSGKN